MKGNSLKAAAVLALLLGTLLPVGGAHAQVTDTQLFLMPHCTETDRSKCKLFSVADATHLTTGRLAAGDILDLDVMLRTPNPSKVAAIRAWLSYDKSVLEARNLELTTAMNAPYPGEQMIDASQGLVKIGAAINGKITMPETVLARVTFRVIKNQADTTVSFTGFQTTGLGQTAVNTWSDANSATDGGPLPPPPCFDVLLGCKEGVISMLMGQPSILTVDLADAAPAISSTSSSVASSVSSSVNSGTAYANSIEGNIPGAPQQSSSFPLLQVQGVVATTRGSDLYVGWKELKSAELNGYNVYYGTVSGRYVQRHSVPKDSTSYVIRDVEPGAVYFVAIRAFNVGMQESAYSQEVSVTAGKPETATNPLTGFGQDAPQQNPYVPTGKNVVETGTGSVIAILALISAGIGTFFAWRRQLALQHV